MVDDRSAHEPGAHEPGADEPGADRPGAERAGADREQLIRDLYDAFNRRDVDALMRWLSPDVDWPDAIRGARLCGHEAVREYWRNQFSIIESHVEPIAIELVDDRALVTVEQKIRDTQTQRLLGSARVGHHYRFAGDLIVRMDITPPP